MLVLVFRLDVLEQSARLVRRLLLVLSTLQLFDRFSYITLPVFNIFFTNGSPISILFFVCSGVYTRKSAAKSRSNTILFTSRILSKGFFLSSLIMKRSTSFAFFGFPHARDPKRIIFSGLYSCAILSTICLIFCGVIVLFIFAL
jgi:hypothetical protein